MFCWKGQTPGKIFCGLRLVSMRNADLWGMERAHLEDMVDDYYRNCLNELIAISSDEITKEKDSIEFDAYKIEWLGYDIMRIGGGSMLLNGLFLIRIALSDG